MGLPDERPDGLDSPRAVTFIKYMSKAQVRARTATPDEREHLWPRLVEMYADFAKHQEWTERTIPVVVLEPR
jgi:hypothetical protein